MMLTKTFAAGIVSLCTALVLSSAGGAVASPPAGHGTGAPHVSGHTVAGAGAAEYWTSERMRSATPGDVLAERALERGNRSSPDLVETGATTRVKGTGATALHADENPVSHIGKVFFTLGGTNYVCSGNSVASANNSTVSTAGHCLNEGPGGFATNFIFVPAYLNGTAPYGKWTAKGLYTTTQWSSSGDLRYDTGFAVMHPLGQQSLTAAVGASGVEFNTARGLAYRAFGYPAGKPFNGQTLKSCSGTATNDPYNPQFNSQGIPCGMTGGSSGGPWFIGTSSAGVQNSVNSYGYSRSKVMYGPYWGADIQRAYNVAAAAG